MKIKTIKKILDFGCIGCTCKEHKSGNERHSHYFFLEEENGCVVMKSQINSFVQNKNVFSVKIENENRKKSYKDAYLLAKKMNLIY